ncbi:phospholipid-transporting ATPase ABCA3-like [Tachypleus tridentatus]|uniref:phospholipid-transporting ATPase ABCA3-like n=1 Tax=Tachypleus tridentatus TaxID=6853 RepID=UPI003FD1FEA4
MGVVQQFLLLIWKGLLLRRRHYIVTGFEVITPLLLSALLAYLRTLGPTDTDMGTAVKHNATIFNPVNPLTLNYAFIDYSQSNKTFFYCPRNQRNNMLLEKAFNKIKMSSMGFRSPKLQGVDSEKDIELQASKAYAESKYNSYFTGGIVFENVNDSSHDLAYKLRLPNWVYRFETSKTYPPFSISGPNTYDVYKSSGFLCIQSAIALSYVEMLQEDEKRMNKNISFASEIQQFPYPSYYESSFNFALLIPTMIITGFIILTPVIVRRIVAEKSVGAKEMMRMMGLNDWCYWSATFFNNFLVMLFISAIITILFKISFTKDIAVLYHTDGFLLFIILLLYSAATILFCVTISTFFNKPVVSVIFTIILWQCSYSVPQNLMDPFGGNKYSDITLGQKLASCLLPNMALHWAVKVMSTLESFKEGATWANLGKAAVPGDNLTLGAIMGMMVASLVVYGVIIWYVDAVWPWQFGIPKPVYFPFTPSYWGRRKSHFKYREIELEDSSKTTYFEDDPAEQSPGIIISNLSKVFGWGSRRKNAVNNVSLNIYKGQITALLGHNGAGKTTTMNMLTGLFPPTEGTASINNYDILADTKKARRSLGLCPQHNVLYNDLTVEEHLKLFAGLKGCLWNDIQKEVDKTLQLLDLQNKKSELAQKLSGGMKRKLSLGIAMIGKSEVLILDEPTSGMDPSARRVIWDVLQDIRQSRTILLTTHYMEEADTLGDRIAIMADGKLQCCGSPLFLKKKFGAGYYLRIAKGNSCDVYKVTEVVQKHVTDAYLEDDMNTELLYSLASNQTSSFSSLFHELEQSRDKLGITAIGVSVTTMEDVFMKVGQIVEDALKESQVKKPLQENENIPAIQGSDLPKLTGLMLFFQQMKGLYIKRFHYTKRHWVLALFQLVLPILIICLMMWIDKLTSGGLSNDSPPLRLDLKGSFGNTKGFDRYTSDVDPRWISLYKQTLKHAGVEVKQNVSDPNKYLLGIGENDFSSYLKKHMVGGAFESSDNILTLTSWYNGEPYHVAAMSLNLMHTTMLRYVTEVDTASITVVNHPLSGSTIDTINNIAAAFVSRLLCTIFLPIAFTFFSSAFILFPVQERISKAKLIQLMAGVQGIAYWVVNFVWDFSIHFVCCVLILIPFVAYDPSSVYSGQSECIGAVFLLMLLYGFASIPLSYIFSFIPKSPSTGFVLLAVINILGGMVLSVTCLMMETTTDTLKKTVNVLSWIFRFIPNFALTWGFGNINRISQGNSLCDKLTKENMKDICPSIIIMNTNPTVIECCKYLFQHNDSLPKLNPITWDENGCGRDMFTLFLSGVILFSLLLVVETNLAQFWYKFKTALTKQNLVFASPNTTFVGQDVDVAQEQDRVENLLHQGQVASEALVVTKLTKYFSAVCAVDRITLGVHKKECFGLLGINGAGKTTTFRMLTGDLMLADGNAYIGGYSLRQDLKKFQEHIGYCPQFDALIDRLTGREMLYLFARLRGVPETLISRTVTELIEMIDLQQHAEKVTEKYSGGNRRKLSLALALIGTPKVAFLDEPTSGVDPVARRKIWTALETIRASSGMAVVLTTHSMEECEALCSRLAIMVNGQFRCLGGIQYLKSKFGQGSTLIVKLERDKALDNNVVSYVQEFVQQKFPGSVLKDVHQGMLHYHITNMSISLSYIFSVMEDAKQTLHLEDYLVSDTTLEQIFLTFARSQRIVAERK